MSPDPTAQTAALVSAHRQTSCGGTSITARLVPAPVVW
jgi:hypothetical protein